MSHIPEFELGLWNAWILWIYQYCVLVSSKRLLLRLQKENISEKNKKLLHILLENGKKDIAIKSGLITRDMGKSAMNLISCIDESVFKTPNMFFSVVFDLWKNLKLI